MRNKKPWGEVDTLVLAVKIVLLFLFIGLYSCSTLKRATAKEQSTTTTLEQMAAVEYFGRDSAGFVWLQDTTRVATKSTWQEETTVQESLDTAGRVMARTTTTKKAGTDHQDTRTGKTTATATQDRQEGAKTLAATKNTTEEKKAVNRQTTRQGLPMWMWYVAGFIVFAVAMFLVTRKLTRSPINF
jgi:hypothetical protein